MPNFFTCSKILDIQNIDIEPNGQRFLAYTEHAFVYFPKECKTSIIAIIDRLRERFVSAQKSEKLALQKAAALQDEYGVVVNVVRTDAEFYSDEAIQQAAARSVFVISAESLGQSALITEQLIRFHRAKYLHTHAERIEKARHKRLDDKGLIEDVIKHHTAANNGRKPSLRQLAAYLEEHGVASPTGHTHWYPTTIKRILEEKETQR